MEETFRDPILYSSLHLTPSQKEFDSMLRKVLNLSPSDKIDPHIELTSVQRGLVAKYLSEQKSPWLMIWVIDTLGIANCIDGAQSDIDSYIQLGEREFLAKHNFAEYNRILVKIDELTLQLSEKNLSPEFVGATKAERYKLKKFLKLFTKWFEEYDFEIPDEVEKLIVQQHIEDSKSTGEVDNLRAPARRLKLSPHKKEILNEAIVNMVNDFLDQGLGSREEAFKDLASRAEKDLGYPLTPKAIEGRYIRNYKKYDH